MLRGTRKKPQIRFLAIFLAMRAMPLCR